MNRYTRVLAAAVTVTADRDGQPRSPSLSGAHTTGAASTSLLRFYDQPVTTTLTDNQTAR